MLRVVAAYEGAFVPVWALRQVPGYQAGLGVWLGLLRRGADEVFLVRDAECPAEEECA